MNIKIVTFFTLFIFFICGCDNKSKIKKTISSNILITNIIKVFFEDKKTNVILDIENLSSDDYYMIHSFRGDLDNREFPYINREERDLNVYFKAFSSKKVDADRLRNEGKEPPVRSADEIGLQKIKSKKKRRLTFTFPYNYLDFNTVHLSLDFGKFIDGYDPGESPTIYMAPSTSIINGFSFEKITMMIHPDLITNEVNE